MLRQVGELVLRRVMVGMQSPPLRVLQVVRLAVPVVQSAVTSSTVVVVVLIQPVVVVVLAVIGLVVVGVVVE